MLRRRAAMLSGAALAACGGMPPIFTPDAPRADGAPPAPREFRGAWIASVDNIDWPSRRGLAAAEQQRELRAIVERATALGLNALVVQVRPACDALYASALEPWSEYLTGTQGQAPGYDPLALWIEEAHARGIELHAWFNPYRARHGSARSTAAAGHVTQRRPGWVRAYGDALWLDPGETEAMSHSLAVIADVTSRYDVDGIHVDDYFYPYPIKAPGGNDDLPFPDEPSWSRARAAGLPLARDDWRRRNVDRFVQQMFERVRALKPWVKVGISPFGLPRPDRRPPGIEGFSQYDRLFADVERWLAEGWLDYLAPQLYWAMEPRAQAFGALVDAWARENARGRHLWPGLYTSAVARPPRQWPADELLTQLAHLRAQRAKAGGFIHFSMAALMDDRGGLASRLLAARPDAALVPASPWLGATPPAAPQLVRDARQVRVQAPPRGEPARWFALWVWRRGAWRFVVRPADAPLAVPLRDGAGALEALLASSVSRSGVESERVSLAALTDH